MHSMRSEFCGELNAPSVRKEPDRNGALCPRCAPLVANILTFKNGGSHAREVMISQHAGEPRRKLLEFQNHYITTFLSDSLDVIALEIESKSPRMAVRWKQGGGTAEYLIRNEGRSYDNRDEMIPLNGFDFASLKRDLEESKRNLQERVRLAIDFCIAELGNP